jgi:hypothetical protein
MVIRDIITVATKSIMPTKRPVRAAPLYYEIVRGILGLSLAFALLWLAVPRTMAAFLHVPGDLILRSIQTNQTVSNEDLHQFIVSRQNALEWVDGGRTWSDQGLAYLRLAENTGYASFAGQGYLAEGAEALKRGLSKAPASPYAWARLAYLRLLQDGMGGAAKRALMMSLFTGPLERRLIDSRIQYGLIIWHQLDASQQSMIHKQILLLDKTNRQRLYHIVRQNPNYRVIALTALASYPERQAVLRAALAK